MSRRYPEFDTDLPAKKKRATVRKTTTGAIATVETVETDPTAATAEGNVRLFINQAIERWKLCDAAERPDRAEGLIDVLMEDGQGQWDPVIKAIRKEDKRPCLTLNRIAPMVTHVGNEQRASRPSIQIDPVGGGADPDSAAIRQGLIRHIEIASTAETVYDTAFESMIVKGWSWFRVISDWESPTSPYQVLRLEGFVNDFCVYHDPSAQDPTRKDMKFAFIVHDMMRGEYLKAYPKSKLASGLSQFSSIGDEVPGWMTGETIRVAEYYYVDEIPARLVYLMGENGQMIGKYEDELTEKDQPFVLLDENALPRGRDSYKPVVKWAKINAVEVLDGNEDKTAGRDWGGKWIPLIMVAGKERFVNGKRRLSGMVRNAREAQQMYNYSVTSLIETIALAPKSPFIAAAGQIEKYKDIWDTANIKNWPYLPYDPKTVDQQNVPPPQRQVFEPPVGALLQAIIQFDNIIKIEFNLFDSSVGKQKGDESGRAISLLQRKGESGNMNWLDNMRRSMVHTGEVLLDLIPTRYDAARIIPIVRPDNEREEVLINAEFKNEDGKPVNYDMAVGTYSSTVSVGEYASKRQEAVSSLIEVAKNVPQVAITLMPLILDNMDTPMAKEAAAILRRTLPPEMQEPGSPEQMQAQFMALMQQHEQLVAALEQANQTIKEKQIETSSKEFVAGLQEQTKIAIATAQMGSKEGMHSLALEFKRITDLLTLNQQRIIEANKPNTAA